MKPYVPTENLSLTCRKTKQPPKQVPKPYLDLLNPRFLQARIINPDMESIRTLPQKGGFWSVKVNPTRKPSKP